MYSLESPWHSLELLRQGDSSEYPQGEMTEIIPNLSSNTHLICSTARHLSLNEPPRDKTNILPHVPSEDSDQPGHPPSLISLRCCAQWVAKDPSFLHADSEDSDQIGRMSRLI